MQLPANLVRTTPGRCCNTVEALGLAWVATPNFGPKVAYNVQGAMVACADECLSGSTYYLAQELA